MNNTYKMKEIYDVVAIGEYLIDFSPNGTGLTNNPQYEMNPGGAPANCLAACARLGGKSAIIAAIGDDFFGKFLKRKADEINIDTKWVQTSSENTTLVFVSVDDAGERDFAFIRNPGADTQIRLGTEEENLIQRTKILHFGTLSLTHNPAYTATRQAVACAKSNNVLVSFDPNYREALWKSCSEAKEQILWGLSVADIVKMSEDELNLATDCGHDINAGMQQILSLGPKEIYVTAGSKGAYFANVSQHGFTEAYCVNAIDTTGCGDAFMGAILYQKCYQPQKNIVERTIMANAAGAICATRPGGMCAMPTAQEVDMFINDNKC